MIGAVVVLVAMVLSSQHIIGGIRSVHVPLLLTKKFCRQKVWR